MKLKPQKDILTSEFIKALNVLISAHKTQKSLADITGIHQSRISDYARGMYDFYNITVGTLIKLFPDLKIIYFPDEDSPVKINSNSPDDNYSQYIEDRLLLMFRRLDPKTQILFFEEFSQKYGQLQSNK